MKAIVFEEFGGSKNLKIKEVAKPTAKKNEVLIKIHHTAVNPVDWKIREGYLQELMPHQLPIIPGWDVAGAIEEVGDEVNDWKVGDKVMAYARLPEVKHGTYAEHIILPSDYLGKIATKLATQQAASIPLVGLTAYQALTKVLKLKENEKVLITGGAGGVGSFAIQFAKNLGAVVFTTGSLQKHEYLKSLGADHVIDYRDSDYLEQLKSLSGDGFDVILDCVGGESLGSVWDLANKNARLVSIVEAPDAKAAGREDVQASFYFVEPSGDDLSGIASQFEKGDLKLPNISVGSIKDAAKLQDENMERRVVGKVVMKIDF